MLDTSAASLLSSLLRRELLPTLGGPRMDTETPDLETQWKSISYKGIVC